MAGIDYVGVNTAFICHDGQGRILLQRRSNRCRDEQGRWDNGAGELAFGQEWDESCRREIKEEYGCDVRQLDFLGVFNLLRRHDGQPTHWVAVCFAALVDSSEVRVMEPEKNDGNQWFTLDSLPTPLHSGSAEVIERFRGALMQIVRGK